VLVTSQLPLGVDAELAYHLEPLRLEDGVAMFEDRAAAALTGFDPTDQRAAIEQVVARVDGMPLAIELAAARVVVMDAGDILTRLDRSLSLLTRGKRDRPERQRSLRATLQWTYDLLSREEQTLLARLGAFAGAAPLSAVDAVAGSPVGAEAVDAADALMGLLDASLVRRSEDRHHGVRFTIAQVVRDFAAELLAVSNEEALIRAAHANHLASLGDACRHWHPGHSDESRARVNALDDELRPALAWTRERDPRLHLRLAGALSGRMTQGGRLRECAAELSLALSRNDPDTPDAGWANVTQSFNLIVLGRPDEARQAADAALSALRAAGDEDVLGLGLRIVSITHEGLGEVELALAESAEALEVSRRLGDPNRLAADLGFRAQALLVAGRPAEAARFLDEGEALDGITDSSASGMIANLRGDCAIEAGDWSLAARCYATSAVAAERFGDHQQMVWDLEGAIVALAGRGRYESALELAGIQAGCAQDSGADSSPSEDWRQRRQRAIETARTGVGDAAEELIARGREVPAERRGTRVAEVVEEATVGERVT